MILTIKEIRDLAEFCGLSVTPLGPHDDPEEEDSEIQVAECTEHGVLDDDGKTRRFYDHVAWFHEYPEEGCCGLGPEKPNNDSTSG